MDREVGRGEEEGQEKVAASWEWSSRLPHAMFSCPETPMSTSPMSPAQAQKACYEKCENVRGGGSYG